LPSFQNPYKETDLSEYIKSLIFQINKKISKALSAVGPRFQKIQRVDEKSTSVHCTELEVQKLELASIIFCEFPSGIKEVMSGATVPGTVNLHSIPLSRWGTECT
jgi:hypothetical protein